MLPVTHVIDAAALADALVLGAVLGVPAAGVPVAGALVGDGEALDEHAVTSSAAATARAPNRRVPFSKVVLLLLGNPVPTASQVPAGSSNPALNAALADC
jgi:hypothetical protein